MLRWFQGITGGKCWSSDDGGRTWAECQIPRPKVKITPDMIEAGVQVLWASGAVDHGLGSDRLLVAEIYRAMFLASDNGHSHKPD